MAGKDSSDQSGASARQDQLDEIIAELMRTNDRGESVDRDEWLNRFPDFANDLQEFFQKQDRLEALVIPLREAAAHALHVRCPHCHNPIELLEDAKLEEVSCPSCGSSFSLVGEKNISHYAPGEKTIGHFQLLDRVGIGAFGSVWKARDTQLDRTVAVKIPRHTQLDESQTELFLRDARSAAQLKHPNIVGVHEIGKQDDTIYIVSDFIQGANLKEWKATKRLTPREAAELCVKIANALHHAHESGVIHRDLKPGNIMMDTDGEPHIVDFGLAKREAGEITMTVEGQILGTPAYMSPEQARGEGHTVDGRADIYSLGLILFELLTFELPFRGDKQMLIVQILNDDPPRLRKLNSSVPRDLETICLTCLEKEPGRRYQTAQEMADDLSRFLRGEPILARPTGPVARSIKLARRKPVWASLISMSVLASIFGAALTVSLWYRSQVDQINDQLETVNDRLAESNERLQDALTSANIATKTAEHERANAKAHESQARIERALARRYEYVTQIRYAELALAKQEVRNAVTALERCVPLDNSSEDLRRFEWYYLWQLCHGQVHTLRQQRGPVVCLAYSHDGKWLASDNREGQIIVWDVLRGKIVHRFDVPGSKIHSLAFDETDRSLYSIDSDTRRTWDLATGKQVGEQELSQEVQGAVFAKHGQFCAVASDSSDQLEIFANGKRTPRMVVDCPRNVIRRSEIRALPVFTISTAADLIVTAIRDEVTYYGLQSNESHTFQLSSNRDVACVTVSTNGRFVIAAESLSVKGLQSSTLLRDPKCKVWIWDTETNAMASSFVAHDRSIQLIANSADGTRIATASEDQTIKVWDLTASTEPHEPLMTFYGQAEFLSLVFSPDGTQLSAADEHGTIRIWSLESEDSTLVLKTDERIYDVAFYASGRRIAGRTGGKLSLWELATKELMAEFPDFGSPGRCAISANGKYLSSGRKIIDLEQLAIRRQFDGPRNTIPDVAFAPNGKLIARGHTGFGKAFAEAFAVILDIESGRTIHTLKMPSTDGAIPPTPSQKYTTVAFSPAGDLLVAATGSTSGRGRVTLWEVASGKCIRQYEGHRQSVWRVAFSPDGQLIAAATGYYGGNGFDNDVWIWDVSTGDVVHVLKGHSYCVFDLAFSPDGTRLSSVSAKYWGRSTKKRPSGGELKLWDVETGHELLSISNSENLYTTAFDAAANQLAIGSAQGTVTIFRPYYNWLQKTAHRGD